MFHPAFGQESQVFFLEGAGPVVFFLIVDVGKQWREVPRAGR